MAHYIVQFDYTAEAWQAMIKNPTDRLEAVRPLVEDMGGRYEQLWIAPWNGRAIGLVEFPDDMAGAAMATAVRASGAAENLKVWPVLTSAEAVEFLRAAGSISYQPPG